MLRRMFAAGLLILGSTSVLALDQPIVHEYQLKNGLKLFVKEDHRAPVVVSQVWYRVGSAYETRGVTGISHVVEHMMFKGTKKYGKGEFSKLVSANGGHHNAFTSDDFTAYYQVFEASKLPLSFKLESDRMQNLILDKGEFEKEIQVVMEERRMRTDDNPQAKTYERFAGAAFVSSPYHHPVVGWMDDLENLTIQDVRNWYNTWYGPNNAEVVVVGDVDPNQVYTLAKKYFGPVKPKKLPTLKAFRNVEPIGQRSLTVKAPAKLPWLIMGYNVPTAVSMKNSWEPYALQVLAAVLDQGNSARFARELVRGKQIATGASAGYSLFDMFDSLLTLSGTPATGHTVDELQKAFLSQVQRLQTSLVNPDELARVKAQVIANNIFKKDSMESQALEIGTLQSVGLSWKAADEYVQNIESISAEQIQNVAKKYLVTDRLTLATLDPQPIDAKAKQPRLPVTGGHHDR